MRTTRSLPDRYGRAADWDWLGVWDEFEDWLDFQESDADPFFRILRVLSGRRLQSQGRRPLRVGSPVTGGEARNQLWGTSAGVFLAGATEQEARAWARQQAARHGGRVLPPEQHGRGRTHLHVEIPNGIRSGHIYWGTPPEGTFFDHDY